MQRTRKLTRGQWALPLPWKDRHGSDVLCSHIVDKLWPETTLATNARITVRTVTAGTCHKPGERLFEIGRGDGRLWIIELPTGVGGSAMAHQLHDAAETVLRSFLRAGHRRILVNLEPLTSSKATAGA